MLVGETHNSLDNPPDVPMFGGKRAHGGSSTCGSDQNAGLTGMANSTVAALSPQVPVQPISSGTKSVRALSYVANTCNSSRTCKLTRNRCSYHLRV